MMLQGSNEGAQPLENGENCDYENIRNEKNLLSSINGHSNHVSRLGPVLFSTMVQTKAFLFFMKERLVVLTDERIIVANAKNKNPRFVNRYAELQGVTKSIRIGAQNFILHFGKRAEEEWSCSRRDQLLTVISRLYEIQAGKSMPIYGLGSSSLEDYITSEKDLQRKISRKPTNEFLLSRRKSTSMSQQPQDNDEEWEEDDEDLDDDFVILERPNFDKYNSKDAIKKESDNKNTGKSQCLVGKPGLNGEVVTLEDFEIMRVVDKGSFGKVFLVYNRKMDKKYAMKRINKDLLLQKKQVQNIKNEKDILFQAEHPFVNSMDFVFQNELRIYFFLKFLPGGNIYDNIFKMKRFQEPTVKFIGAQIVLALGYLHGRGIVHRDLKPENVLMDADGYISLADFGLAKFLQKQDQTYSFCGTAEYLAPEILNMTGHGFSVDWWTLGILLYEMATGRPPFLNKSHHKLGLLIRTGKIIFPDPVKHKIYMSEALKDIILKLLDRDASKRLGTKNDMQEIQQHPFFDGVNWQALLDREIEAEYKPDLQSIVDDQMNNEDLNMPAAQKKSKDESKLINVNKPTSAAASAAGASTQAGKGLGLSILDEDARDILSQQQQDYVRQNQDKFKGF